MEDVSEQEIEEVEKPLTRAYHWTDAESAEGIKKKGLMPSTPFGGNDYMTYCMLGSAYPKEWTKYKKDFNALIERFGENPVIVSFDVYEADNAWVTDDLNFITSIISRFKTHSIANQGKFGRMVPLNDYKSNFRLPELVLFKTIPPERLTFLDGSKVLQEIK